MTIPQSLKPLFTATYHPEMILNHWDDLLRVAGSLKNGWVTASLLISKLQAYPQQNILTQALQEYGRLVKTIFILNYLDSKEDRRHIRGTDTKWAKLYVKGLSNRFSGFFCTLRKV
jgi:TnpA family transposase